MTDSAAADELMDGLGKGGVVGGCAIVVDPCAIVADTDADSDCTECEEAGRDAVPAATVAFLLASGSAMTVGMVVLCWYGGGGGRRRFYWVNEIGGGQFSRLHTESRARVRFWRAGYQWKAKKIPDLQSMMDFSSNMSFWAVPGAGSEGRTFFKRQNEHTSKHNKPVVSSFYRKHR